MSLYLINNEVVFLVNKKWTYWEGTTIPPIENKRKLFGTNFYNVIKYYEYPGKIY